MRNVNREKEGSFNQNERPSSALNHCLEESKPPERWGMNTGLVRAQICPTRVQWPLRFHVRFLI